MSDWYFPPSAEDRARVEAALRICREAWGSILNPPFPAAFDGSMNDVEALDYADYEGLSLRGVGLEEAALVCGETLRRAAGLEWAVSYRGDWLLAWDPREFSPFAVNPLARLHELECGGGLRGHGVHAWFVRQAAFEIWPFLESEERRREVRGLFETDVVFLDRAAAALEALRGPPPRRRRKTGGR